MAELLKVMQAKDEGAFRAMQVTRPQTAYAWRELEKTRNEMAHLQDALSNHMQEVTALRALCDIVYSSRSWRITKPLRTIAARLHGRH
jgi:hypothetical protein